MTLVFLIKASRALPLQPVNSTPGVANITAAFVTCVLWRFSPSSLQLVSKQSKGVSDGKQGRPALLDG